MEWGDEGLVNEEWLMVSGKLPKPRDEDELLKWETKAERAAGEIYLLVENDQRVHFRGREDDPIEMWKLLEAAHLSKKPGACFNAYDDLFSIRKQDSDSLMELGIKIEKAMQTIQNLRPVGFTIEQLDEELQCMALIRALPEEYRHLSSTLLLADKLDKATILQAFRSEELNRQRNSGESLNKAQQVVRKKQLPGDTTCYYCKEKGHITYTCPTLKAKKEKGKGAGGSSGGAK